MRSFSYVKRGGGLQAASALRHKCTLGDDDCLPTVIIVKAFAGPAEGLEANGGKPIYYDANRTFRYRPQSGNYCGFAPRLRPFAIKSGRPKSGRSPRLIQV